MVFFSDFLPKLDQPRSTTSQPHVSGDAYEQLRCNSTHVLFSPLGPLPSRRSSFPPSGAAGAFSGSLRGVESPKFGAIGPNRRPGPPGEYVWRTELDEYNSSVGAVTIPQNRLWSRFGLEDGTSGSRGRRASSSILTNAAGLRICRECKQTGRYKDGKCIEKWGPGPAGPGTVCDRCRKRMKRSQQRIAEAEATLAMMSHTSFGHSQPNFHTLQHPEQPSAPPAMPEMSGHLPCPDVTGNELPRAYMPSASTSTGSIMRIQSLLGDSVGSAPSRPRSGMSHRPGSSSSLSRSDSSESLGETEADGPSQSHNSISYEDNLYSQAASRSMTP
ncbi:uncharacterized protein EI90DRAFT_620446 [Cantharellus anzutake]|uniref:uncharacterized protein n=1 Tax=Cantharellus anzutake TaxID=1750568 RepID=UPI00190898F6|nr:uncharacterized protein EI90DRAFT_620446 [Cantharellus anzutake]KAF8333054.1 hypothetical protein EI90DRAFT_620446 [Cantharellus anzutake]